MSCDSSQSEVMHAVAIDVTASNQNKEHRRGSSLTSSSSVLTDTYSSGPGQQDSGPSASDPASSGGSGQIPESGLALQPSGGLQADQAGGDGRT